MPARRAGAGAAPVSQPAAVPPAAVPPIPPPHTRTFMRYPFSSTLSCSRSSIICSSAVQSCCNDWACRYLIKLYTRPLSSPSVQPASPQPACRPPAHLQRGGGHAVVLAQEVAVVALQAQVQQVGAVVPGGGVRPAGKGRAGRQAQPRQGDSGEWRRGAVRRSGEEILGSSRVPPLECRGAVWTALHRYRTAAAPHPLTESRPPCCWG